MKKATLKFQLSDDNGNVIFEHERSYRPSDMMADPRDVWGSMGRRFVHDARYRAFTGGHLDEYMRNIDIGYSPPKDDKD